MEKKDFKLMDLPPLIRDYKFDWQELSIADLTAICLNANEKIRIYKETGYTGKRNWLGLFVKEPASEETNKKRELWQSVYKKAIETLDKKILSLP